MNLTTLARIGILLISLTTILSSTSLCLAHDESAPQATLDPSFDSQTKLNEWVKTIHLLNYLNKLHDQEQDYRLATKLPGENVVPMTDSEIYAQIIALRSPYQQIEKELTLHLEEIIFKSKSGTEVQKQWARQKSGLFFENIQKIWNQDPVAQYPLYDILQDWDEDLSELDDLIPAQAKTISRGIKSISRKALETEQRDNKEILDQISEDFVYALPASEKPRLRHYTAKQSRNTNDEPVQTQAQHCIFPSAGVNGTVNGTELVPGTWVLTYDDGPHPQRTRALLNILAENDVVANFFILSRLADQYTPVVHRALDEGHMIANHSHTHARLHLDSTNLNTEIIQSNQILTRITSHQVRSRTITELAPFYRCPGGSCISYPDAESSRVARQMIAQLGLVHATWSVDARDWERVSAAEVVRRVRRGMRGATHGIVLLHDVHQRTIRASQTLIPQDFRGLNMRRLDDAVHTVNCRQACPGY